MDLSGGETSTLTGDDTSAGCLIGAAARASGGAVSPTATERAARKVNDRDLLIFIHSFSAFPGSIETHEKREATDMTRKSLMS